MDELIDELLERHNQDVRSCLAWCIGYIDRMERTENGIRSALGYSKETPLIDDLNDK